MSERDNKLFQIFEIVAKINGFQEVNPGVFVDDYDNFYYLDTLGFHTQNQFCNNEIIKKEKKLDKLIRQYDLIQREDVISPRSKKKLRKILKRQDIPDSEKVRLMKINLKVE